jgi:hypothetical protein
LDIIFFKPKAPPKPIKTSMPVIGTPGLPPPPGFPGWAEITNPISNNGRISRNLIKKKAFLIF